MVSRIDDERLWEVHKILTLLRPDLLNGLTQNHGQWEKFVGYVGALEVIAFSPEMVGLEVVEIEQKPLPQELLDVIMKLIEYKAMGWKNVDQTAVEDTVGQAWLYFEANPQLLFALEHFEREVGFD